MFQILSNNVKSSVDDVHVHSQGEKINEKSIKDKLSFRELIGGLKDIIIYIILSRKYHT